MTIPSVCHCERVWWENLGPHIVSERTVGSLQIAFVIERTRAGCVHACTIDDICHVLSLVSVPDLESLETIVMRQSTRKQWSLNPTWGRIAYSADLGRPGRKARRFGPAVFLEATNPTKEWKWSRKLDATDSLELDRLKSDGHRVEDTGRNFILHSTLESVRATQLYRTLLHEIGHWVDWLEKVVRPTKDDPSLYDFLSDRYFARPQQERESFAHHYADALRKRLTLEKHIPFQKIDRSVPVTEKPPFGTEIASHH